MPVIPLAVTASLVAADWGLWDWATAGNRGTIALIAGLLMAPFTVALVWFLALTVLGIARLGARQALGELRSRMNSRTAVTTRQYRPFDIEAELRAAAGTDPAPGSDRLAA